MKFQIIATAVGLSLLASPGCKKTECPDVLISGDLKHSVKFLKAKISKKGTSCKVTIKAKQPVAANHEFRVQQFDKEDTKISNRANWFFSEMDADDQFSFRIRLEEGVAGIKLVNAPPEK